MNFTCQPANQYWCAIFCAIGLIFLFFFMEETNYSRPTVSSNESLVPSPTSLTPKSETRDFEKVELPSSDESGPNFEPRNTTAAATIPRKTYIDKLKLFQNADLRKPNGLAGMVWRPLVFLTFPVIFYAGFCYGSNLVWFNVLNATSSLILGKTYNFSASMVGLSYISPLIGCFLASFYSGVVGDRVVLQMVRRNNGILESEHRLWLFLPSLLLIPGGLLLWGVGAAHRIHWFGCVFAMGVISFTNIVGLQLSVSYCIDSYKALSGEAMVTVILVRNTMSFAIGYGITPWLGIGLQNTFIVAAFAALAQCATFLIMVRYGKGFREKSIGRYEKYVGQITASGMVY